jgi:uncharacterized membrane protein
MVEGDRSGADGGGGSDPQRLARRHWSGLLNSGSHGRIHRVARRARPQGIGRLEAFSDAVLAIVLTLLVLDLLPKGAQSPGRLVANWPTYLAYLAAFLTIGIIWLNHNQAMSRVRSANPVVQVLNLGLLLGASLVPWPTALISTALQDGDRSDQIAAMFVFAIVTVIISVPWLALDLYLVRHPHLLGSPGDVKWMQVHARVSIATLVGAGASVGLAFVSALASLVLYLAIGVTFIVLRLRETDSIDAFGREEH